MNTFWPALWAETLKLRRSRVPLFTAAGFSIVPLIGGLFMVILKDPDAARSMGLISTKAQMLVGTADWPTFFSIQAQAVAVGGGILFSMVTLWVFGREFSDRTAKELLALPTPREAIVAAKFVVTLTWTLIMTLWIFVLGLGVGAAVDIPGGSAALIGAAFVDIFGSAVLVVALSPFVALLGSLGRGYLAPMGWVIFTIVLAQVAAITGWGEWFPWSVPALFSGAAGPRAGLLGPHSYFLVLAASLIGLAATFYWWRNADQTR